MMTAPTLSCFLLGLTAAGCFTLPPLRAEEVRDPFRQMIRADPLVDALIEAMTAKNHGCPVQELKTNDPMRVMKEVEPFFYDSPTAAMLDVQVVCSDAVRATVHGLYDDRRGGRQPLMENLHNVELSYGDFIDHYLARWPTAGTTPEEQVLNDPLVVNLLPVLRQYHRKCEDAASGNLSVAKVPLYSSGIPSGKKLEYMTFSLTISCPASSIIYYFKGKYFTESGYVTWDGINFHQAIT